MGRIHFPFYGTGQGFRRENIIDGLALILGMFEVFFAQGRDLFDHIGQQSKRICFFAFKNGNELLHRTIAIKVVDVHVQWVFDIGFEPGIATQIAQ